VKKNIQKYEYVDIYAYYSIFNVLLAKGNEASGLHRNSGVGSPTRCTFSLLQAH